MIFKIFGYILLSIAIIGFCLNLLVMILLIHFKQTHTHVNSTLLNLIFSDFAVCVLGSPFNIIAAFSEGWVFSIEICLFYGFIMSLLGIVSITTLSVLSFLRYLLILNPLHPFNTTIKTYICLLIAGIWIYSLLLTSPPLFGWAEYHQEGLNISCSVNWESKNFSTTTYIIFLFVFGFFLPISIILYSYYNILMLLKKNSKNIRGKVAKAEYKVTIMIFTMILSFLFSWTPYAIMALLKQFGSDIIYISPEMASIPAIVAKSSICYNPIIYVFMNRQLLKSIKTKYNQSNISCYSTINRNIFGKLRSKNTSTEEREAEEINLEQI